jgi:hypothetical protein
MHGSEESYREAIGAARLGELTAWSQSTSTWQGLFA